MIHYNQYEVKIMTKLHELAQLIYPNLTLTIADLEAKYPPRNLSDSAMVTRFAPSPTGFLHTGSLFASLVSYRMAKQSQGVFFVRLEDTDQKREIIGSAEQLIDQLHLFGVVPDESFLSGGAYGPYAQSERKFCYDTVIKELIIRGDAYPCFCSHDELSEMRAKQEALKVNPGYYGEYATCRRLTTEEMISKIQAGMTYVIRFKSHGKHENKIAIHDEIRGNLELTENDQDIVIMKTDGLPTYHFAHLVDDHFMRTTHITRGEEWLPSLPIHLELFDRMNWTRPKYCHLPVIMKLEDGRRRKLSKRKDPEASVSFFLEAGYPIEGILEYLMTIANSNFEEWRIANPTLDMFDFSLTFQKMTLDGALFDIEKVQSISKEKLGAMDSKTFVSRALAYAIQYNKELFSLIESDVDYFERIISIERGGEKPRKDYNTFMDILPVIGFMYDEYYYQWDGFVWPFQERFTKEQIHLVLQTYLQNPGLSLGEVGWFENMKELCASIGFSPSVKDYKKNKDAYLGHVGDFAEIIRIAVSKKNSTPNFYQILSILGEETVKKRIRAVQSVL
jgi:glutamyl-tRNA synthetase